MKDDYSDIIKLPHHVSSTRPQMSMMDRAAQFSPFAALTGHDAAIRETGRLVGDKTLLEEDALIALDLKFQVLRDQLETEYPEIHITYFKPDARKNGGSYETITAEVKEINDIDRNLILLDGTKIPLDNIVDILDEGIDTIQRRD